MSVEGRATSTARGRALAARAWPALAGLGLGALALGPGLRRGFLLSYDMVIVPRQPFTAALAGLAGGPPRAVPSDAVVAVASRVLPADLVQKLLLLSIFVLACSGAAALLAREPWFARLAAGACYAWNPFVAERLIIGQWALLLGYAGLPWALRAVTTGPVASWRGAGRLGVALLPAIAGGFAAMTVTALVVLPTAVLARPPGAARSPRRRAADGLAALGVLAVGSLPWLIPSLMRPVYAGPAGVAAFAARADTPFGSLGSLVMLGGMWNAQAVPAGYGGWWSVLWLAFVLAAAAGYVAFAVRQHRWPGLGIAAMAGLILAGLGVTAPGRDLLRALGSFWPGFAVLRDGQQFAAPLALAEALGAGLLVAWAARPRAARPRASRADSAAPRGSRPGTVAGWPGLAIAVALILAPVLLLPGLAWGAAGRLHPVWYPPSWLNAARLIDGSHFAGKVLLLPWAAYRRPAWNGGRALLDPWPRLLSRPVIWNDGPQVGEVRMRPDDPAAGRLGAVIAAPGPLTPALMAAGVRFVIADGGLGTPGYARRLPGCAVVATAPGLVVYQVPGGTAAR
ncbi:MAG TPA: hypothetical protein VGY50_08145 [Streptosporangiaceae bacterium]|nr:hypothetical protein [Streptosporangiaceae bacterium]